MGRVVAAFRRLAVALFHQNLALGIGQHSTKGMITLFSRFCGNRKGFAQQGFVQAGHGTTRTAPLAADVAKAA